MPDSKIPRNKPAVAHEVLSQIEEHLVDEGRDDLVVLIQRARNIVEERLLADLVKIKIEP